MRKTSKAHAYDSRKGEGDVITSKLITLSFEVGGGLILNSYFKNRIY